MTQMNLRKVAEEILNEVDDIARDYCNIDYGLPLSDEKVKEQMIVRVVRFIEMCMPEKKAPAKSKAFVMPFGKHKGLTFDEIEEDDPNYLDWVEENMDNERVLEALTIWRGV